MIHNPCATGLTSGINSEEKLLNIICLPGAWEWVGQDILSMDCPQSYIIFFHCLKFDHLTQMCITKLRKMMTLVNWKGYSFWNDYTKNCRSFTTKVDLSRKMSSHDFCRYYWWTARIVSGFTGNSTKNSKISVKKTFASFWIDKKLQRLTKRRRCCKRIAICSICVNIS